MHIHFIGINGSGISGAAAIAAARGYKVSGCDQKKDSNYSKQFKSLGIIPLEGHDENHITDDVDLVVITPHFLYKDLYKNIPELVKAKDKGILIKWQEFMGKHILANKNTVAICGTHGKTTTTSLIGLSLESANIDPTVLVGGIVPKWNRTFRNGNSDFYVIEADEYDNNFIHYNPKYTVFHTLEMEHPEIFNSFEEYREVFVNFLKTTQENGTIFFNMDSKNICDTIESLKDFIKEKSIKLVGYGVNNTDFICDEKYYAKDISFKKGIQCKINDENIKSDLIGMHNVYNLLASYCVYKEATGKAQGFSNSISDFKGAKRRMESIFENDNIKLYNDYAHHHNQVKSNLEALKITYPNDYLIAVIEPHQISRLTHNTQAYLDALNIADEFFVSAIFKGREKDKDLPDVNKIIAPYRNKALYEPELDSLVSKVLEASNKCDKNKIIVVMGAGDSYKITENLEKALNYK